MSSGCIVDFVTPGVDDGLAIDVGNQGRQAFVEFVFGADADVAQDRPRQFEKKPSMRLSHDPWVGVNVKVKRPIGCAASQFVVSRETWAEWLSRMSSIAVSAGKRH
jgi:hypothetical protein